jgi:hypothetical protein
MEIFRPKQGPILRWSRGLHLLTGILLPMLGYLMWNYNGLGLVGGSVVCFSFLWEISNRFLVIPYSSTFHKWGDVIDMCAFWLGDLIGCMLTIWLLYE